MVIISTSAVEVSIQAVSPLSILTGAAAAASAAAGAAVCARADALAAKLPSVATSAAGRSERKGGKRIWILQAWRTGLSRRVCVRSGGTDDIRRHQHKNRAKPRPDPVSA